MVSSLDTTLVSLLFIFCAGRRAQPEQLEKKQSTEVVRSVLNELK